MTRPMTRPDESKDIHYTVIDRDSGERFTSDSSTSRDRAERRRNELALKYGKEHCLGIGQIDPDGTLTDVT